MASRGGPETACPGAPRKETQSRLAGFPVYSTGMKTNHNKATPRACHTLRQVVQRIPRWLIERTANAHGVDARRFSATSPFVMPVLGHLSRASCLTEICDDADLNRGKLRLVRNATPGRRNTFSYANRARPAEVAEEVYWVLRQKDGMRYEVAESREASGDILSDETVRLTAADTARKYTQTFRRVRALVEIDGEEREMTFLTNNAKWAARTVCEPCRARWAVEVFFRENRGDASALWDGIAPAQAAAALHPAAPGGLLSARARIPWDSIPLMAAFHRDLGTGQSEKRERKPVKQGLPSDSYAPMGW